MSRRRSLVRRFSAALVARRRSVATGMFRLRRSFGNPVVPESVFRSPLAAESGVAAPCGVASAFVMGAEPLSRLGGLGPGRSDPPWADGVGTLLGFERFGGGGEEAVDPVIGPDLGGAESRLDVGEGKFVLVVVRAVRGPRQGRSPRAFVRPAGARPLVARQVVHH